MTTEPDHRRIYLEQADRYELLVSREDFQSNIFEELAVIESFAGKTVVDLGTGTGRLARLIAPHAQSIIAFDASRSMLNVAGETLREMGHINWQLGVADHRALPVGDAAADSVISGWSIVYLVVWHKANWDVELQKGLDEIQRILKPGGSIIILETLGTGHKTPEPPEELRDYYAFLEAAGFDSTWIRTDYRFQTLEEAQDIVRFFFGDDMVGKIETNGGIMLPECTGIWWKRLD